MKTDTEKLKAISEFYEYALDIFRQGNEYEALEACQLSADDNLQILNILMSIHNENT